jgi:alkane 1-monooxygenase
MPQILLVVGTDLGVPGLSVIFFFIVLPIIRLFLGNDLSASNENPSRFVALYLTCIPRLYVIVWTLLLSWTIWELATKPMTLLGYIAFAFSFWIVTSLNTAIAHDLIHSRSRMDKKLGRFLDATVGYFHFSEEHATHHQRTGYYHDGDAAIPGTSVYVYAVKRYLRTLRAAWKFESSRLKRAQKNGFSNRLIYTFTIPVAIASIFYGCAGKIGLVIYLFQVVGSAFTVQAITYLQHWGLTEKETPELADYGFSWEDGCWMQACVTLNHAFHGQHHAHPGRPYYQLVAIKGGLTLPASYPVMFIIALFPKTFSKLMRDRLNEWIRRYQNRELLEHNDDCLGAMRAAKLIRQSYASNDLRMDSATGSNPVADKS